MDTTNNKTNPVIIVAEACSEVFTAPSTPTKASTPLMATPTINTWSTKLFPASLWWPYRAELVAAAFLVAFAAIGAVLVHHHLPWGVLAIIVATMPVAAKLDAWRFDISYGLPDPSAARAAQPQPEGSAEKVADAKQAALLAPGAVTAA
jgi:hypothetical protein